MDSRFRQVALFGKYQAGAVGSGSTERLRAALGDIAALLQTHGCAVVIEAQTAANAQLQAYPVLTLQDIGQQCDLALVVGGDGTMLGISRQLASYNVPLIGINHGRLGFMTDIPYGSFESVLPPILRGQYEEEHRALMHARVLRQGQCVFDALAMNDVVLHRGNSAGMVELRVEVDGHFVASQRADGLIVATPTGSTAYSLSAGGPILHPAIAGWVLAPIAPHTLSNRPIVLSNDAEVAIEIVSDREAVANFDMQTLASLHLGDRIIVRRSEHAVRFLHPRGWSYFDTLRQKLHWNEGVAGL
jgi:NAD+ kinase